MAREPNPCSRMRKVDFPYEVYHNQDFTWEWRVLKKYQSPSNEAKNPLARWFVAVRSPFTHGSFEYGDTYAKDVKEVAFLTERNIDEVKPDSRYSE